MTEPERGRAPAGGSSGAGISLLDRVFQRLGAGITGRSVAGGAAGTFVFKGLSFAAAFLTTLLLTNLLGADGYGAYAYAMNWAYLLMIPALLGFDRLLLREIPVLEERRHWPLLRGLLRYSTEAVIGAALLFAAIAALSGLSLQASGLTSSQAMLQAFLAAMLLLPVLVLLRLRQTFLLAKQRFVVSQTGEMIVLAWGSLVLIAALAVMKPEWLTAESAILANLVAGMAAIVVMIVQARTLFPDEVHSSAPEFARRKWITAALPMMLVAGMQMLNQRVDILMVGTLMGEEPTGIYNVANRGVQIIWLVFYAINLPLAPVVAQLHERGEHARLENLLSRAARISVLLAIPAALLLAVFATPFLSLFGPEFPAGRIPLLIMIAGQLVTMAFGSASTALIMTGLERAAALGIGLSAGLNVVLNLVLIPRFGMNGAAWALVAGQVSAVMLMAVIVRRRLGINCTLTGRTL